MTNKTYATEAMIEEQLEVLDMSSIIKEGKKYTSEVFPEIDINQSLADVIKGNINNKTILMSIISLFGKETVKSITTLGSILIIIVIHSILKSIGENIGNEGVAKIAYYVEYILIVTIITTNFSQIITSIRDSITNLTGFMNSLLPILLALISATRADSNNKFTSTSIIIFDSYNRKYYQYCDITNNGSFNNIRYCIKFIRKSSSRKVSKIFKNKYSMVFRFYNNNFCTEYYH